MNGWVVDDRWLEPPLLEVASELSGVGGLPGALDADEHEDVLPPWLDLQGDRFLADECCKGVVDDLDDVFPATYPWGELLVEGPFLDDLAELQDELDVDVRLEERSLEVAYQILD